MLFRSEIPPAQMTGASALSGMFMYAGRSLGIALAAILLNLMTLARGATDGIPTLIDFRIVIAVLAILTLGSLFWFIRLPPGVAADVSGHRA